MNVDECLAALVKYDHQVFMAMPRAYYDEVAGYWFALIAPYKTREYGTECWQRLGPRGFVVNMSAMRYRWTTLMANGLLIRHNPTMFNCLVDAFGFAMLFNLCLRVTTLKIEHEAFDPADDDEWIIEHLWNMCEGYPAHHIRTEVGMRAIRMAYNMWRLTWGSQTT